MDTHEKRNGTLPSPDNCMTYWMKTTLLNINLYVLTSSHTLQSQCFNFKHTLKFMCYQSKPISLECLGQSENMLKLNFVTKSLEKKSWAEHVNTEIWPEYGEKRWNSECETALHYVTSWFSISMLVNYKPYPAYNLHNFHFQLAWTNQ